MRLFMVQNLILVLIDSTFGLSDFFFSLPKNFNHNLILFRMQKLNSFDMHASLAFTQKTPNNSSQTPNAKRFIVRRITGVLLACVQDPSPAIESRIKFAQYRNIFAFVVAWGNLGKNIEGARCARGSAHQRQCACVSLKASSHFASHPGPPPIQKRDEDARFLTVRERIQRSFQFCHSIQHFNGIVLVWLVWRWMRDKKNGATGCGQSSSTRLLLFSCSLVAAAARSCLVALRAPVYSNDTDCNAHSIWMTVAISLLCARYFTFSTYGATSTSALFNGVYLRYSTGVPTFFNGGGGGYLRY